jgi:hypothetical protein
MPLRADQPAGILDGDPAGELAVAKRIQTGSGAGAVPDQVVGSTWNDILHSGSGGIECVGIVGLVQVRGIQGCAREAGDNG